MCGILGYVGKDYNREQFERALESMSHRGPDDSGTFVKHFGGKIIALGQKRLAIIDLSRIANQPMSTPDRRFTIAFNGEIYNYQADSAKIEVITNWAPKLEKNSGECIQEFRTKVGFSSKFIH